ncbi:unnamed protein product [Rhizoctonia solani]|uniref:Uncharacterized protein n=1 Tax=Rhizoctonia solani TaxID=456999 RepID=A0A8H3A972_9AGAM|nr:unnamed protein product [Rhizoctonia solani]
MTDASPVPISWASYNVIPDKYMVRLKDDADLTSHLNWLQQHPNNGSSKCEVINKLKLIKGYGAELKGPVLEALTRRHDVKTITQDCRPDY